MNKSIYNTPNNYKHDIFRKRLKDLCKNKHLTYVGLADKIGYTEDAIKRWTKTNGGFPNMETLVKLSCIFDVDVAYLLGDQDCMKIESQQIHNLSGLSESASNIIQSTKDCAHDSYVLNKLLTHKNFPRLLEAMYQYAYCHNVKIKMEDETFPINNFFPFTDSKKKTAFKFTVIDTFSEILEDIYKENEEPMAYAKGNAELEKMFNLIHEWNIKIESDTYSLNESVSELREKLLKIIDATLKALPEYPIYNTVRQFNSEDILKNYKEISKTLNINLDFSSTSERK